MIAGLGQVSADAWIGGLSPKPDTVLATVTNARECGVADDPDGWLEVSTPEGSLIEARPLCFGTAAAPASATAGAVPAGVMALALAVGALVGFGICKAVAA